ncbi:uncharacterized protein LOC122331779 [Puntigrus tetrazona]|uniref:uncharacterized protein LOC122331779 n=1 Tax=Puntigrus tetrazona TaxID=1606681 RepID=UPI001C89C210|nr:uncharacterized protein LOC122331779 [Puntigrus tetrazona]
MNLFCFTLDGSTDSLYEPAQIGQNTQDLLPRRLPSPNPVKNMSVWRGSEPCIATVKRPETHTSKTPESTILEKAKRKSQLLSTSEDETTGHTETDAHWPSTRKKDGLVNSKNHSNTETVKDHHRLKLSREEKEELVNSEKAVKNPFVQGVNFEAWNPNRENSECRQQDLTRRSESEDEAQGTLKKIQKLVGGKKGNQSATDESKNNTEPGESIGKGHSPVITCINLTKKAEKKHTRASTQQSQQPLQDKDVEGSCGPGLFQEYWSPVAYSPAWDTSTHTCHRSTAEQVMYNFNFTLPRDTDWEKYEELFHRLDPYKRDQQDRWITHSVMDLDTPDALVRR